MNVRPAVAITLLVALAPAAPAAPAFDDQRLFTTPAERARLDELRAARQAEPAGGSDAPASGTAGDQGAPTARPEPPPPAPVRLRGFVRRSDGPGAVWVNDASSVDDARLPDDLEVHSGRLDGATVVVTLPDGRRIRLKPGQTWDPESGRVVDSYRAE